MLHVFGFTRGGVDEDRKDPCIAVGHVDISCEILRAGNCTTLGVNTSFQFGLGT